MTSRREAPDVLLVELSPLIDRVLLAIREQRREIARVTVGGQPRELTLVSQAPQEPVDVVAEPRGHAARASSASLTMSPIRTRKSVLIVGR